MFKLTKILCIFVLTKIGTLAFAADPSINVDKNDLAIGGYDPVAYFSDNKAKKGKSSYTAVHDGAIYHFSSAKNRDLFRKDAEKYAPQYGGFCAFGVTKHRKFTVDPKAWRIVDGKLYLNLNKKIQGLWVKDISGHIGSSEKIWPEIEGSTDTYLESVSS